MLNIMTCFFYHFNKARPKAMAVAAWVGTTSGIPSVCSSHWRCSAVFGETTTIMLFAAQLRGMKVPEVLSDYSKLAASKAAIIFSFHLILADPTEQALTTDLPQAIKNGINSFKIYMTGHISIERFVALTATNHARVCRLYPHKGLIAVGTEVDS
jgi:dihydroorotase-like cyclic amidohydrolase